jgi:SlyX protein
LNDSIKRLEEKIAYLERHVTEQDKAMLEMADALAAVRRELKRLRERGPGGESADAPGVEPVDERPPHY